MDKASYHSGNLRKLPTTAQKKKNLINALISK